MTGELGVTGASVAELALRLTALRGTAVYAAYLVADDRTSDTIAELGDELRAFDPSIALAAPRPHDGDQLIDEVATSTAEVVLVDASGFGAQDWELLDRRRSALAHPGVTVFVTTPVSFAVLMRSAPNLASWLGALVFAHDDEPAQRAAARERRLAALRSWASRSDEDVIRSAESGTLPRDPEYAEWLVLLGRGDLLDPREP